MIKIYRAEERHSGDLGWLKYTFSFSFAEYNDPENISFGPLRVFNDDVIQPTKGFGTHPHRDMEIVTFVLKGELKHEDNTGGKEILRPGEVQRMTAGTGILHSEVNSSEEEETNTLQLWILPREHGLPPSYEQKAYDQQAMKNQLLPVVSSHPNLDHTVFINQDLTIYVSELGPGQKLTYSQEQGRKIYLFLIEGDLSLNQELKLNRRDTARMSEVTNLELTSDQSAFFMLIDLP